MVQLNIEFRLLEVRIELSGLREALQIMESQIQFLSEKRKLQAEAELNTLADQGVPWDGDVILTIQERDYAIEHLYPRLFRGPFLITLWAIYESGVKEVARFVKRSKNIELDIDEIRESDVRRKTKRYFEAVLGVQFASDQSRAGDLGKLYKLRNAFAHANGRVASLSSGVQKTVESMIEEGHLDESLGYVIPTSAYLELACNVVHVELTKLVEGALAWHNDFGRPE